MKPSLEGITTESLIRARGSFVLFGHEPRAATVSLVERDRAWRVRRAALYMGLGLALAPVVVLFPPHVPWLLGALGGGAFLAWRTLQGRYAMMAVEGGCPRCQAPVEVRPGTRLRSPHPLHCPACHHEFVLHVAPADLPGGEGPTPTSAEAR